VGDKKEWGTQQFVKRTTPPHRPLLFTPSLQSSASYKRSDSRPLHLSWITRSWWTSEPCKLFCGSDQLWGKMHKYWKQRAREKGQDLCCIICTLYNTWICRRASQGSQSNNDCPVPESTTKRRKFTLSMLFAPNSPRRSAYISITQSHLNLLSPHFQSRSDGGWES
jgi:hypothetical protein